jgi:hypothetical protein
MTAALGAKGQEMTTEPDTHTDLPLSDETADEILGGHKTKTKTKKTSSVSRKAPVYPVAYIEQPGLVEEGPPPVGPDDDCSPE